VKKQNFVAGPKRPCNTELYEEDTIDNAAAGAYFNSTEEKYEIKTERGIGLSQHES
jgi:hypothetical protein